VTAAQSTAPWEVAAFSPTEFRRLLALDVHTSGKRVETKQHTKYFEDYLAALGARTIVAERYYVDRDFLEDFAAYYVRCHEPYSRLCARLHFFARDFTSSDLEGVLSAAGGPLDEATLRAAYLGFIVVKPLPETIFGRTCLRTYEHEGRRHFPITRSYRANLFGLRLQVQSLAFQEQDQAAAACATSALWSAFQGTGILFQHHIPSPVEITRAASEHGLHQGRALPSTGLTTLQMAHAIRRVTLEPTLLGSVEEPEQWKATAYAYIRGGVPVVVTGNLVDHDDPAHPRPLGKHAVVLAGYSLGGTPSPGRSGTSLVFAASRIDKFYAHDDQIGAFARMQCRTAAAQFTLDTSWKGGSGGLTVRLDPEVVFLPLYHKIRVAFSYVRREMLRFEALLQSLRATGLAGLVPVFEWDVFLTDVNTFKSEVANSAAAGPLRRSLLEARMPRFIWRAIGLTGGRPELEVLFDATGIENANCCFRAVEWSGTTGHVLRALASADRALLEDEDCWRVVSRIVDAPP
jgi:hypothetical protein